LSRLQISQYLLPVEPDRPADVNVRKPVSRRFPDPGDRDLQEARQFSGVIEVRGSGHVQCSGEPQKQKRHLPGWLPAMVPSSVSLKI
jgi:hypothetical protein